MSYFTRVEDYKTYENSPTGDLHYSYNANSGGGQAFLGGKYRDDSGELQSLPPLNNKIAVFGLDLEDTNGNTLFINLGTSDKEKYPISPRGEGSTSMKLGMKGEKNRPSLLLATALMLPTTCVINSAATLDESPLTRRNYWLRSMWLDCRIRGNDEVAFIPKDFIFEGGRRKEGSTVQGDSIFYKLDYRRRIADILHADELKQRLPQDAADTIGYFANVYRGETQFNYDEAATKVAGMMKALAFSCADRYSGISDPLPTIMRLVSTPTSDVPMPSVCKPQPNEPYNLIYFGAPGTGKSYKMNKLSTQLFDESRILRVTFHPDYTYAQFVGSLRPYTDVITGKSGYRYTPGPFVDAYVQAMQLEDPVVLLIEEINRANPAAVFGDVFQLLDREDSGESTYPIRASEELTNYLSWQPGITPILEGERATLSLPKSLFLWATMNSADQGVFPMDTAFKRRWDFEYLGINDNEEALNDLKVPLGETGRQIMWNDLRHAINDLLRKAKVNEDKLIGPYFMRRSDIEHSERFNKAFKNKVLMYLYEDAARMRRDQVFADGSVITYSQLCENYDRLGDGAFKDLGVTVVDDGTATTAPDTMEA